MEGRSQGAEVLPGVVDHRIHCVSPEFFGKPGDDHGPAALGSDGFEEPVAVGVGTRKGEKHRTGAGLAAVEGQVVHRKAAPNGIRRGCQGFGGTKFEEGGKGLHPVILQTGFPLDKDGCQSRMNRGGHHGPVRQTKGLQPG